MLLRRGQWNEDGAEDAAIKAVANSTPNGSAALLARIDAKLEQYAARHAAVPRLPPVAGAEPQPT